jgi:hypothetical protein
MLIVRLGAVYIVSEMCQLSEDERHHPKRRCNLGHKEQLPLSMASSLVIFKTVTGRQSRSSASACSSGVGVACCTVSMAHSNISPDAFNARQASTVCHWG